MYKIYPSRLDNFMDALGLAQLMPWRRIKPREFWALRDISIELKAGSRLGIIGRNGAGKSTLLKLITGNLAATEGAVHVNGQVQALLEAGAGFHPEFTGYENIRAALTYQGFNTKEIEAAIADIAEFTELGQFLAQPFKTYSNGMQARLVFATATTLKPDILIIDEILGAGDAYFAGKSVERMKELVEESGASVLLVSHALDQVARYCDECIWIERGRIIKRGPSMEVIDAYEGFIRTLEDRRLKAKNRKRHSANYDSTQIDGYGDALVLAFQLWGVSGDHCEIAEISLLKNGQIEETLKVGDVQDASWSHASVLALDGSNWSEPQRVGSSFFRSLIIQSAAQHEARGEAVFYAYALFDDANYAFQISYRCDSQTRLVLTISRNGSLLLSQVDLPTGELGWRKWCISLPKLPSENSGVESSEQNLPAQTYNRPVIRWPSEGSLTIEKVRLLGADGQEQAVFPVQSQLILSMTIVAHRNGHFDLVPGATLYRLDGVFITNLIGEPIPLDLKKGESRELRLNLNPLNLGDGHFVFSLSIFEKMVALDGSTRYDLVARGYEFQVVGNNPLLANAVFSHMGHWTLL
ncbi:MAG: ATP-binding cassette domain-containing protein [Anaerolineales bacterium]|nr:ATP-binding cassette domain-containing protein [Anaerolineales bacterium]